MRSNPHWVYLPSTEHVTCAVPHVTMYEKKWNLNTSFTDWLRRSCGSIRLHVERGQRRNTRQFETDKMLPQHREPLFKTQTSWEAFQNEWHFKGWGRQAAVDSDSPTLDSWRVERACFVSWIHNSDLATDDRQQSAAQIQGLGFELPSLGNAM